MITIITTVTPMLMTTSTDRDPQDLAVEADESAALFRLMTWLSPSFPVGSFSYSSGIEWAVEAGDITSVATLQDWLAAMLQEGAGFCDGTLLCHAYRAAVATDGKTLNDVAELAAAFVPSRERHLETTAQGRAFVEIARSAWNCDALDLLALHVTGPVAYPVAVGVLAAGHRIPLVATLHAFLHATTSNWISAGVRLIPLGQTDSQRALAALESVIAATADRSLDASLDDLASATFRADLASMHHEAQYTRLFRS
jgi:urease accessory protein